MIDPLTDMFNRIRNAQAVGHETVDVPFSKIKNEIAIILEKEKFIEKIEKPRAKSEKSAGKIFRLYLNYDQKIPAISEIKQISKPSQRIQAKVKEIKMYERGHGITIMSTPKGLMTSKEAKKQKTGGEIICQVY